MAQPIEIFRVRGVGEVRNPIEALGAAALTPLTGRDVEMTLLKDRWERAQEGAGQIVLLIGEPGLGKSRLVYTLKQLVREQAGAETSSDPTLSLTTPAAASDPPVVEWRCFRRLQNTGLYPATEFFERFLGLGLRGGSGLPVRAAGPSPEGVRPRPPRPRAAVCDAPVASDRTNAFPPCGLPPVREREETFRALVEWLRAYCRAAAGPLRRRGPSLGGCVHAGIPPAVLRGGSPRPDPDGADLPARVPAAVADGGPPDGASP